MVFLRSTDIINECRYHHFTIMFIEGRIPLWKIYLWDAVSKTMRISLSLVTNYNIITSVFIFNKAPVFFFHEYEN